MTTTTRKPIKPPKPGELDIRCTLCDTLYLVRVGRYTDEHSVIGVLRRRGWRADRLRDLACPGCAASGKRRSRQPSAVSSQREEHSPQRAAPGFEGRGG